MNEINESSCNIASRVICTEKMRKADVKEKKEFFTYNLW